MDMTPNPHIRWLPAFPNFNRSWQNWLHVLRMTVFENLFSLLDILDARARMVKLLFS